MKIYFAGSIRGGRGDAARYQELIQFLATFGTVLTEHVGDPELTEAGDDGPNDPAIHDRDMTWLRSCALMVAEVTLPSLGVGYELGWACALGKPVLALYRPQPGKRLSAMVAGSPGIVTAEYATAHQAREILRGFIVALQKRLEIGSGAT
ncbi:MAG: nucleoside 2-deoxyribosyltransferase [Desulfobacterales bacterium]|nr:nucleoside 2-deoxyribosyltransferase [Desulfobacterales bacterium]